jgi:hypothetical protein
MQEQEEDSGPTDTHDLILCGARVIGPSQNLDHGTDVRFTGGGLAPPSMAPGSSPG